MIVVEQQLHGYRHGHELLSGTLRLPPRDQDLLDTLSDVAGPLGPGERFAPYLTCYPLPSETHYIVARTWQDLTAPRAGCVRTRSLLVSMEDWLALESPANLAESATQGGPSQPAERIRVPAKAGPPLPFVQGPGIELVEALFLEERVPVAVFGADMPEVIALRLLTAVWPSLRRRFTVSTFCNSPRSIGKRSFDLVFAPVEARSRFADWKGRRVDGRRSASARHRWSTAIFDRVFRSSQPTLLGLDVLGEMAGDQRGSEDALRVSLLWDELWQKVASEPLAALGLLDIANTRGAKSTHLVRDLEPALARAAATAIASMAPSDAWRFLETLTGKLGDAGLRRSMAKSIRSSAVTLARQQPRAAIEVLPALLRDDRKDLLLGSIGDGLARSLTDDVASSVSALEPLELLRLVMASPSLADAIFDHKLDLSGPLSLGLKEADVDLRAEARRRLLRHLVEDRHVEIFRNLVMGMTGEELVDEVTRLQAANGLSSGMLDQVIVKEARRTGARTVVRDFVGSMQPSSAAQDMLAALIEPTTEDAEWILDQSQLSNSSRRALLIRLFDTASQDQLRRILSRSNVLQSALDVIGPADGATTELLTRIVEQASMDVTVFVDLVLRILPSLKGRRAADLAARGVEEGLGRDFGPTRDSAIATLLAAAGTELNGRRALHVGLATEVPRHLASRNVILFDKSTPAVRSRFLHEPEGLVAAITARPALDLTYEGAEAAAHLLWDSETVDHRGFIRAAATLLPFAMRERHKPASALIAVAFPPVYRELQKERLSDFLGFVFPFIDWDRCKSARRELAEAFFRSDWLGTDIALAAARAGDPERILKRIARRDNGAKLAVIEREVDRIPTPWRQQVRRAIKEIMKNSESWMA